MGKSDFFGSHIYKADILTKNGKVRMVDNSYFHFNYDQSIIQKTKDIVLSVTLRLTHSNKDLLWKKAMEAAEYRKKTQPQGVYSMGCTFRNIAKEEAFRLNTPSYTCSAGYLIEQVGLKGHIIGHAAISDKHANFILNQSRAASSDVLQLIALAKEKVKKRFGVDLKEEIVII